MIFTGAKNQLKTELQKSFSFPIQDRVTVLADIEQYKYKEDESVWQQKKGINPHYFSVFWDLVHVCGFDERTPVEFFMVDFWKNFKRLYKEGKVSLNGQPIIKDDTLKESDKVDKKKIEALPESNKTQKMAKEVIKRLSNKNATRSKK